MLLRMSAEVRLQPTCGVQLSQLTPIMARAPVEVRRLARSNAAARVLCHPIARDLQRRLGAFEAEKEARADRREQAETD